MTRTTKKTLITVLALILIVFIAVLAYALSPSTTRKIDGASGETSVNLNQPQLIQAGAYVAAASDCIACHTTPGGKPFAGGRPVHSPIGNMYSSNITPDKQAGIGNYTLDEFDRAIRHGIRQDGVSLYPAMPYPSYAKMSDQDIRALYAYMMHGVQPVNAANRKNDISWPLSIRWPVAIWRKSFAPADMAPLSLSKYQSQQLARGAYLVQGPGHCGTCHTPRAVTMQEKALDESGREFLAGGPLIDGWRAVNLRSDKVDGLGSWSEQDIVDTLRTGRNGATAVVGGPMNDVVAHSMQWMNEGDLRSIALYLKSLPATGEGKSTFKPDPHTTQMLNSGQDRDNRGAQLYLDNCNACHRSDGHSNRITFPALPGNPTVLADDPTSLIRLVLAGSRLPSTQLRPSDLAMPGFGWRLSDEETAQVATFVRQGWGNHASEVSASQVAKVRKEIKKDGGVNMDERDTSH